MRQDKKVAPSNRKIFIDRRPADQETGCNGVRSPHTHTVKIIKNGPSVVLRPTRLLYFQRIVFLNTSALHLHYFQEALLKFARVFQFFTVLKAD